jgi:hypothetical protein
MTQELTSAPLTVDTPQKETSAHAQQLRQLRATIKEKHPQLKVETLLMALDGSVERLA